MNRNGHIEFWRAFAQPVTYLGVAMLVTIYCALTYLLIADRKIANDDAARDAGNLVRIFDQSLSNIFKSADAALLFLRKAYQHDRAAFDLGVAANEPAFKNDVTFHFTLVGADGRVIDSSLSKSIIGAYRGDRESVHVHVNATSDQLFISEPLTLRSTGERAFALSRRITAPDGTFGGVIVVLLDPNQLGQFLRSPDLGPEGSVALIGLDGVIRVRTVDGHLSEDMIGRKLGPNASLVPRASRASAGIYWNTPGTFDNVKRLVAYRVLEAFPLIAVVTLSEAHVFRNANKNARIYWGIVGLLSAGILVAIFFGAARERKLIATTSEMKQAEEALRRSEERYALVEEATNDGVWDWNRITGEVYLSPRWKNILGYADDELPNTDAIFLDRLHPDDQPIVQQMRILPLEGDRPFSIEVRLRHKDGNYRWVLSRGKTIFDADGRPARRLGTITDVTDRTHAREKLREQVAMLDMAQVFIREVDGQILTWNTGAAKFYGWQSEEAISRVSHELFQTAFPIPLADINERLLKDGRWEGELEHTCKDGRRVNVASLWVLHTARASREPLVIETNIDIAARKQTEAELARANIELEARVAERTADLAKEMRQREEAQQTLAQMQKMEAVGQLSAGMAHDFNNLLAVMMGSLEFIAAAAARGTTAEPELIEAALRSGRRGKELVQRLLSFARQMPIRPEPTPANQLILDTLRLLQRTLGASVAIETNLCLDDATILVDRNQLANALVNLALNARDAMPEGGELTIATTCQPAKWASEEGAAHWPTGEEVCIVISDTGTGMTDEVCKRAFEPFFTTKYDGLGSGLGLSMVHGFVAQSGGHIEIDSNPGRGTTITIRLPRIEAASYGAERNAEGRQSVSGDQRVVLLVEDDPDVRVLVAAQLKVLGFRAYAVASGVEAIDLIESPAHIDIMLTDIVLPGGIDGVTLVKEAVRTRPAMGVLCMSGYATTNKHSKWLSVQNIRVLDKPFSLAKLAQALDAISPSSLTDQEPQRFDKLSA